MVQMDLGAETALNIGTPAFATTGTGATASPRALGRLGRPAARESMSFHDELQAASRSGIHSCNPTTASDHKAPTGDDAVDPQPAAADATSGGRKEKVDTPTSESIGSLLLQLLQGVAPTAANQSSLSDAPAVPEEGAASKDAASEMLARVLELLKQLASSSNGASPQEDPDMARMAELLDQIDELSSSSQPAALSGKVHQLLAELHEHLSGVAWGKMVKEMTADRVPTAAEPGKTGSPVNDAAPEAFGPMQTPVLAGSASEGNAAESRFAISTGTSAKGATSANAAGESPAPTPSTAALPAAANSGDGHRGGKAAEALRSSMSVADTSGPAVGFRNDQSADMSGSRSSTGDRSLWKALAEPDAAPDERTSTADSLDMTAPDPRLPRLPATGPERTAEAVAAGKEKEPAVGASRSGLFDQIVQRAVVQVRNDQSEIKIDLKPDFLGNVRMQILTENQQVSVRITTELPAVRDMIEAGLQQLKSELQNQGLHVDRLEVSVSDDPHKQPRRQAKSDASWGSGAVEGIPAADRGAAEDRLEPVYYRSRSGGAATIDMFA